MGYAQLSPTLVVDGGGAWGLHMGAPVRLRLWGGEAGAGRVRREDWDSLSDWGQLVRALKLRSEESAVALWAGALEDSSLLSGHLVRRYSNRANPDYHPAGGYLTSSVGPLFVEAFSSDMLGARLVGAQAEVDLAHVDGTAVVVVRPGFELHVLAGWGGRPDTAGAWGAVVGMGADTWLYPRADGTLSPVAFASVGMGVDDAR